MPPISEWGCFYEKQPLNKNMVINYMYKKIIIIIFLFTNYYSQVKIVGYYPYWYKSSAYTFEKISYENLTHIIHAFAWPKADGTIEYPKDFLYPELIKAAHNNGLKILIGLGGWGNDKGFAPVASNEDIRKLFISNLVKFIKDNEYDGVDFDWEFPKNISEGVLHTILVKEIRDSLNRIDSNYIISMAASPGSYYGQNFEYEKMVPYLDWVAMMGYDFHGSWSSHAGHNAPLYQHPNDNDGAVHNGVLYLLSRKINKEKLLVGVPFYGKEFNAKGLYATKTGSVIDLVYSDIAAYLKSSNWIYNWDDISKVPYLINFDQTKFITFDDTVSIRIKCDYIKTNNLGGIMIWALGQDYMNNEQPLLLTIGKSFGRYTNIEIEKPIVESNYKLYDNYPNPFNPSTRIRFFIPKTSKVILSVYDILGQLVSTLIDEELPQGNYEVVFDGSKLSSGMYFYNLTSENFSQTKKMVLIK